MVVILGIFYFGQDERLKDEDAVKRGVDNAVDWLAEKGYRNVLIEVNNECNVRYDHAILKPDRVHELIERVKKHRGKFLVGHELRRRHGAEGERRQGVRLPAAARQRRDEARADRGDGPADAARCPATGRCRSCSTRTTTSTSTSRRTTSSRRSASTPRGATSTSG